MEWTGAEIRKLKELLKHDLSSTEIARRFGPHCTKNMIIGKVRRLHLQFFNKPGRRAPSLPRVKFQPSSKPLAPKLPTVAARPVMSAAPVRMEENRGSRFRSVEATYNLRSDDCRWPIGHPEQPDFHYCCKKAIYPQAYCDEHFRAAYKQPDR